MKISLTEEEWNKVQEYISWKSFHKDPCKTCESEPSTCGGCREYEDVKQKEQQLRPDEEIMKQPIISEYISRCTWLHEYEKRKEECIKKCLDLGNQVKQLRSKISIELVEG